MKRLKTIFRSMQPDTATYTAMYDARIGIDPGFGQPYSDNDPVFWYDDISFRIESPHKMAQDKPIFEIMIPLSEIDPNLTISTDDSRIDEMCAVTDAAADFCLRAFAPYLDSLNAALYNRSRPDCENGAYYIYRPKGEILTRSSAYFALRPQRDYDYLSGCSVLIKNDGIERPPLMCLCIRIQVQLPAKKLKRAMTMLTTDLPEAVELFTAELDRKKLADAVSLAAKQTAIRSEMKQRGIVSFIADGSILPREKDGVHPLEGAVPFISTEQDAIELSGVRGMGIRKGVTVITGGGYSGKSTLLDAIAAGIYNHCPGDGRELVLTDASAVSIAAEDGRAVSHLNISPFIRYLPSGTPEDFSTDHASGSTSQAANIMEAVHDGAHLLLIDEDRSATNFMIRDSKMKALISKEPITPFTERVRELAKEGVSTILVIGGSGEYLGVSDRVYLMDDYIISDVTEKASEIFANTGTPIPPPPYAGKSQHRRILAEGFTSYPEGSHTERLEVSDMGFIIIGGERVDIRGLFNIVSDAQLNGIAFILRQMMISHRPGEKLDFDRELDAVYDKIAAEGLHTVFSSFFTTAELFMDLPRKAEVKAVVHRMRHLHYAANHSNL